MHQGFAGLVLAAGHGTRMNSDLPKVLHEVCGRPILDWVVDAIRQSGVDHIGLILSPNFDGFRDYLSRAEDLGVVVQENRLGTGDAVAAAHSLFDDVAVPEFASGRLVRGEKMTSEYLLVCAGDIPAVRAVDLKDFVDTSMAHGVDLAVLGMNCEDPKGYGRLVTTQHAIGDGDHSGGVTSPDDFFELEAIVEERDADDETKKIHHCNTGIIFGRTQRLFEFLCRISNDNSQQEYYLTDCVRVARQKGIKVFAHIAADARDFAGVNTREQLVAVEGWMRRRLTSS